MLGKASIVDKKFAQLHKENSYRMCLNAYFMLCVTLCVAFVFALCITPLAWADDETSQSDNSGTATFDNEILDTQNLLGSNLSQVRDAIATTKEKYGVSVRLIYVQSIATKDGKIGTWAHDVLESTKPAANTVLLAVASDTGELVVTVSSNSDEWLRSQSTVDKLSDAALAPLVDKQNSAWAQSALNMMHEIATVRNTATPVSARTIGIVAVIVLVLILIAIAIVILVRSKNRRLESTRNKTENTEENLEISTNTRKADAQRFHTLLSRRVLREKKPRKRHGRHA